MWTSYASEFMNYCSLASHKKSSNFCLYTYTLITSIVAESEKYQIHTEMDVPVLELQRFGCKSVELSIDEITNVHFPCSWTQVRCGSRSSLGGGRISLMKIRSLHLAAMQTPGDKPEFTQLSQAFIGITESTANVPFITSAIRAKWGGEYVLVTAD